MSEQSKHTPGPLYVDSVAAPMSHNGDVAVLNSKRTLIALAYLRPTDGEALANARLFAAAPDLLEACKTAKRAIEDAAKDTLWDGDHTTVVEVLEHAIVKAEGGAQ